MSNLIPARASRDFDALVFVLVQLVTQRADGNAQNIGGVRAVASLLQGQIFIDIIKITP